MDGQNCLPQLEQDFHWESTVYVMWPCHSFVIEGRLFYQFER